MDAVFHLAASVGNKKSIDEPIHDTSHGVLGTINVLEAVWRHDVGNIVYSSGLFNIGTGTEISIERLADVLWEVTNESFDVAHGPPRPGDVRHCSADAACLRDVPGILPGADILENLKKYYS